MNEIKNYPWHKKFQIPETQIKEWQETSEKSLIFYALKNRLIDSHEYFNWASDYYQVPILQDMYFEQNLMKKKSWNEIKDIYDWTEEILPVAFWNNTIFIGCVEINDQVPQQILGYDSRIVLVSQKSLQLIWSFSNTLSDIIEKTFASYQISSDSKDKKLDLNSVTQTNYNLQKFNKKSDRTKVKAEKLNHQSDKREQKEEKPDLVSVKNKESENKLRLSLSSLKSSQKALKVFNETSEKLKATFRPDLPNKKKEDSFHFGLPSSVKSSFPEEEEALRVDENQSTFPGRSFSQPGEDHAFVMEKKKEKTSAFDKNKDLLVDSNKSSLNLNLTEFKQKKDLKLKSEMSLKEENPSKPSPVVKPSVNLQEGSRVKPSVNLQEGSRVKPSLKLQEGSGVKPSVNLQEGSRVKPSLKLQEGSGVKPSLKLQEGSRVKPSLKLQEGSGVKPSLKLQEGSRVKPSLKLQEGSRVKPSLKLQEGEDTKSLNFNKNQTATHFSVTNYQGPDYTDLWNYTKKHYCSSMVFNVKGNRAYLDSFIGRLSVKSKDQCFVDFKDYTFFKVVQRGYPYNGFVVKSSANTKFFNNLDWKEYPKYTTAIPIKDSSEKLERIFVGFSLKSFSKQEIQNIQKDILDIIQKKKVLLAA